jgi:hypothetical protein
MEFDGEGEEAVETAAAETPDAGAEKTPATFAETIDMETLEREAAALDEADMEKAPEVPAAAKPKKRLGKPVIALVVVALLLGGAAGAFYVLDTMGIRIPFVSDLISPAPDNVNRVEVMQGTVRSKFVENEKAGKLFVITGQVRNNHRGARNFISVSGKLFAGGKPVQTKTVFAGNVLSGVQLSNMDMQQITKRLRNRVGDDKSNMNVSSNQTLPFMIVFNNLPDNLEEFVVEPGESVSAQ